MATKRCITVVRNFRSPWKGSRCQLVAWRRRETLESISKHLLVSYSAPADIRELHTKVGMACEVELDTIGGRTKNPAARNVCSRSVSEKRAIRSANSLLGVS